MLYKFKSKVTGDLIMTAPVGDRMMTIIGREPAAQGILLADTMPAAIAALEAAVLAEEAERRRLEAEAAAEGRPAPRFEGVTLRQRAWPLIDMLRTVHAAGKDIVWGV
ncbi:MAG: hypothetical protein RJA44_380 [Pseudomonadota bacterium]|jgi:hypothetical protein